MKQNINNNGDYRDKTNGAHPCPQVQYPVCQLPNSFNLSQKQTRCSGSSETPLDQFRASDLSLLRMCPSHKKQCICTKKEKKKKREYTSIICGTKKYILSTDVISCIFHFSLLAAKNNRQRQYEKEYRKSLFSNFSHFLSLTHLLCVRVRRRIPKII